MGHLHMAMTLLGLTPFNWRAAVPPLGCEAILFEVSTFLLEEPEAPPGSAVGTGNAHGYDQSVRFVEKTFGRY